MCLEEGEALEVFLPGREQMTCLEEAFAWETEGRGNYRDKL